MASTPPWGTHPDDVEPEALASSRSRLLLYGLVGGCVILCGGVVALDVTFSRRVPFLEELTGVVLLAPMAAAVGGAGYGFRIMTVRGVTWWGRLLSLVLLGVSAWTLVLAAEYDNAHRGADGMATPLGEFALLPPVTGVIAAMVGIGITWVWAFTPGARAVRFGEEVVDPMDPPSGWPPEGAQPPFAFTVPHHKAWHQIALPMTVIVLALLAVVSAAVHDWGPLLLTVFLMGLMTPFLIPLIMQSYWRRLVVRPDGLSVVRIGSTRLIPWAELSGIELDRVPGSQSDEYRMWLITTRGRFKTDVPSTQADAMAHWREIILNARPAHASPAPVNVASLSPAGPMPRIRQAARTHRRALVLWLLPALLALPALLSAWLG